MRNLLLLSLTLSLSIPVSAKVVDVYFGTSGSNSKGIYQATLDTESGKLSSAAVAAEIGSPGFLAMDTKQSHLYAVANDGEPCVAAYSIDSVGKLTLLNTEAIGNGGAAHISVHPSGKFLLTAQYRSGSVALFPIAADGSIEPRGQLIKHEGGSKVVKRRQDSPHPHWTGYSPDGKFAFVPDLGKDQIIVYKVDTHTPSIVPHGHIQALPGSGPRHMRFSADGKFIYLLNELTLSVTTFAYNANTGTAQMRSTTAALSEEVKDKEAFNSASEILVHPNREFVYSANRGNDTVTVYQANPKTGQLKVLEVEAIRGSFPRNINLDPSAKWLLAAGQHSNTVAVFAIDQDTGGLTFQTRNIISVPGSICILFRN